MKYTDIINGWKSGAYGVEDANKKLQAIGAGFTINPDKNKITPDEAMKGDERNGFGMLDTGTGSMDKVEIREMKLVHNIGDMKAFVKFNGKLYEVKDGEKLVESGVDA